MLLNILNKGLKVVNIQEFTETFKDLKDLDKVGVNCDHPDHVGNREMFLSKQAAKRNILKNNGQEFICRNCCMSFRNPMNQKSPSRQTEEIIQVVCDHPDHVGDRMREMKKCNYYGSVETQPYVQICKRCAQLGKQISKEQRKKISETLTGRTVSEETKEKISKSWENASEERKEKALENLQPWLGRGWNKGLTTPNDVKEKISIANQGKIRTEEQKNNISVGRKKMLEETGGFTEEHKNNIRLATLKQYAQGFDPNNHHVRGQHISPKAGTVFFRSSYEKKAFLKLDGDDDVANYSVENVRIDYILDNEINSYLIDIEAIYKDGTKKLIEIKPAKMLKSPMNVAKIEEAQIYAKQNNYIFEVWTEVELFGAVYHPKHIINFAGQLKADITGVIYESKKSSNEQAAKYYDTHIRNDKVKVFCEYCKKEHEILKVMHENNIAKNGRYICIVENGAIIGKRPKKKKENPYAISGKKQCNACKTIKLFEDFTPDKTKNDGYSTRCKECRAKSMKAAYHAKNKLNSEANL